MDVVDRCTWLLVAKQHSIIERGLDKAMEDHAIEAQM